MSEEKKNLPAHLRNVAPEKITKQNIIALLNTETIRWNYNKMLQGLQGLEVTKDNLKESYPEIKEAEKFIKYITDWRKWQAKPFNDVDAMFLESAKEIIEPILAALNSLKTKVRIASDANAAEIAKAKKEQARIDLITQTMGNFINKVTADITLALDDTEIVRIQRWIGSEKSKKSFYSEYYNELCQKCEALNPIINEQKSKIRNLQKLNEEFNQALGQNDDQKASGLKEKIEEVNFELTENSIRLQEKAFQQSLDITQVEVGQPEVNVVKSRTTRWKWRVDDIDFLRKKFPSYVKVIPNTEAIDEFMKEQRILGSFQTIEDEVKISGITFYKEKYL